jgi:gamma-glutamyl hydrolase
MFIAKVVMALVANASAQSLFLKELSDAPLDRNEQPVIGILSQTLEDYMKNDTKYEGYQSYIMSSYVKYIEAQGARVVPIIYGEPKNTTLFKVAHVDGVLFPGGDGDDVDIGRIVFDEIIKQNDQGHYYPAWGTCLGYENMIAYTADEGFGSWGIYDYHAVSLPLTFLKKPEDTKMFKGLGKYAYEFAKNNFTYNSHHYGIAPETFKTDAGLAKFWDVTSESFMPNGTAFTASIEAKNYPIFGTQFHPEKPSELWTDGLNINHSWESIELQEHFSRLLVEMARTNKNSFGDFETTQQYEISNYKVIQSGDQADVYVFA